MLCFVYETASSFILQDVDLLSSIVPVTVVRWSNVTKIARLFTTIPRSNVVFIWFAKGQAAICAFLFAKLFGKKVIAVAGGSEVCPDEQIHGSGPRSAVRFLVTRIILRNSDYVLAVSEFTRREVLRIAHPRRLEVVYHGIDSERFFSLDGKDLSIMTVAAGMRIDQMMRKGLDRFARLAKCLPNRKFIVVGDTALHPRIKASFPRNVRITGTVSRESLLSYYQRASFYCQLSRHEGFGVAVAEAMACECVPVVSDAGALPEVVGPCGLVVPNGDPVLAASVIRRNSAKTRIIGKTARRWISSNFTLNARTSHLKRILSEVSLL